MRFLGPFRDWLRGIAADWDDNKKRLDEWSDELWGGLVDAHPGSQLAVVVATLGTSVTRFPSAWGQMTVDLLNVGEGVESGTAAGYGRDGLRVLTVAAPVLKGYGRLARVLWVQEELGNCGWISVGRALQLTQTRHFNTLNAMARTMKLPGWWKTGGLTPGEILKLLQTMGAKATPHRISGGLSDVEALARANPRGVVVFSVKGQWLNQTTSAMQSGSHSVLARWTGRRLQVLDPHTRGGAMSTVDDLQNLHASEYGYDLAKYKALQKESFNDPIANNQKFLDHVKNHGAPPVEFQVASDAIVVEEATLVRYQNAASAAAYGTGDVSNEAELLQPSSETDGEGSEVGDHLGLEVGTVDVR